MLARLLALWVLMVPSAAAFESAVATDANTQVQLVSEAPGWRGPGNSVTLALRFEPDPGWHIYWKNPGDSGLPVSLTWELPEGIEAGPIQWPVPMRIFEDPLMTYGYEGETWLLVDLLGAPQAPRQGSIVPVSVKVTWLACEAVCIPGTAELSLTLPQTDTTGSISSPWQEPVRRARSRLPLSESDWSFSADQPWVLGFEGNLAGKLKDAYFFPDFPDGISFAAGQTLFKENGAYRLQLTPATSEAEVSRLTGVLKIVEADGSVTGFEIDQAANWQVLPAAPVASGPQSGVWAMLLFAFLGGIILNLMPCVFPVLSIKILNVVEHYQKDSGKLLGHGLIFSAGVISTFLALAVVLIALRSGGEQIGWGFQLQSPRVVFALAVLFWMLTLNLFGVFEIGTSLTGLSWSGKQSSESVQTFMSGVLATIVATPCTAPFMGTALGFALTQPTWVGLSVFASLGAGMALPYLLLCLFPGLLRWVPRPGPWMVRFKQFLGVVLFLTVLWLVWVLNRQVASLGLLRLSAVFWITGLGCWVFGYWCVPSRSAKIRKRAGIIAAVLLLLGVGFGFRQIAAAPAGTEKAFRDGIWETYSEERLQSYLDQGRPVFVDFTAAWCLSCQVNEKLALDQTKVLDRFRELNVVMLKADWTNHDEHITQALARLGRNSIPVYALYNPQQSREPVLLPEILTPGIVLEALDQLVDPQ